MSFFCCTKEIDDVNLSVGQPFFIQAAGDGAFDFFNAAHPHPMPALRAPHNTSASPRMHFTLTDGKTGEDDMYLTMHDDAVTTYTIGRDIARMSADCKTAAQLWCLSAEGAQLNAHGIAEPETEEIVPRGLFALKAGEYMLEQASSVDEFEVELLADGSFVATLFADQPVMIELKAGDNSGYALRIRRKQPTDISNVQGGNAESTKVVIDDHLYILRGGHIFDAQGKMVK